MQRVKEARLPNLHMMFWLPVPFMVFGAVGVSLYTDLPTSLMTMTAVMFNVLMAIPAFWALYKVISPKQWVMAVIFVSLFAYAIESCGVLTGWPYGAFSYGHQLGPKLFSVVPILLPFSYVPLVIGALAIAKSLAFGRLAQWALGVVLLVSYDLVLDPGAVKVGYWVWEKPGSYYGIPLSNYLGWFLSASIGIAILSRFFTVPLPIRLLPMLLSSFFWSTVFWVCVCVIEQLVIPALVGFLLMALCIHLVRRKEEKLVGGPSLT